MEDIIEKEKVEKFRISKRKQQEAKKATTPNQHSNRQEDKSQEKNKFKRRKENSSIPEEDLDRRSEASQEEDLCEQHIDEPTNISIHEEEAVHQAEASPSISTHEEDPGMTKSPGLRRGSEVTRMRKQKNKKRKDEYNFAWWNLWWKRMEREGGKDLNLKEQERQNNASSSFLSRFLASDKLNGSDSGNSRLLNRSMKRNFGNARHPEEKDCLDCSIVPANNNGRGLKRGLSGNLGTLESPAKKSNTKFSNLLTFWGGQERIISCNQPPRSADVSDAGESRSSNPDRIKY